MADFLQFLKNQRIKESGMLKGRHTALGLGS